MSTLAHDSSTSDPIRRADALTVALAAMPRVDQATRAEVLAAAAQLQALGVHLFPIAHGGKTPAVDGWPENATTDPSELAEMYRDGQNLGAALGRSRLIVVDADTEPAVDAFKAWKPDGSRGGTHYPGTPTVQTPGNGDDHAGGGHWWVDASGELRGADPENRGHLVALEPDALETAPEVTLTAGPESVDVVTAKTGRHYVLVPGSVRDDVADPDQPAYVVAGAVTAPTTTTAPGKAIVRAVATAVVAKEHRAAQPARERTDRASVAGEPSDIDDWAEGTTWAEILEPAGWTLAQSVASCGCARWSRPGKSDGSPSATAHDQATCAGRFKDVFKVFSDTAVADYGLEPDKGYNKAQTYAFVNGYDPAAEVRAALADDGHVATSLPTGQFLDPADAVELTDEQRQFWLNAAADVADVPAPVDRDGCPMVPGEVDMAAMMDGDLTPEPATIWTMDDGTALLYPGKTHTVYAPPGGGKSLLMQHAAVQELAKGNKVLYLDYEDGPKAVLLRMESMGLTRDMVQGRRFRYLRPEVVDGAVQGLEHLTQGRYSLVIVDGVTRAIAAAGKSSNSGDEYNIWQSQLVERLAEETGAAVVTVDHVAKAADAQGTGPIGSGQKIAQVTGAAYRVDTVARPVPGRVGTVDLYVSKDKVGDVNARACPEGKTVDLIGRVTLDASAEGTDVSMQSWESMDAPTVAEVDTTAGQGTATFGALDVYMDSLGDGHKINRPEMAYIVASVMVAGTDSDLNQAQLVQAMRDWAPNQCGGTRKSVLETAIDRAYKNGWIVHPSGDRRKAWRPTDGVPAQRIRPAVEGAVRALQRDADRAMG